MRRYVITLGALSTSGGRVVSASSGARIGDAAIALEGDLVACPACDTSGKIMCIDPRIPETWHGKNVALENDLCICRCVTPPRLMPNQTLRSQVIKDSGRALSSSPCAAAAQGAPHAVYSDRFVLVDDLDGAPLAQREYAVVRASGKLEFGTSDQLGRTHVLSSTAQSECVEIYAQGPLMSASLISPSGMVLHHRARRRTTPALDMQAQEVKVRQLAHQPHPAVAALAALAREASGADCVPGMPFGAAPC